MKEKIGIIGDLHGRRCWQNFVNDQTINRWIFLGDYADSMEKTAEQIYGNIMDIIEFKKKNMDNVILLIGNHDLEYRFLADQACPAPRCTGFREEMAGSLHFLLMENKDLFQTAYQIGNHLFTHAGVSEAWYNKHKDVIKDLWERLSHKDDQTGVTMADVLNALMETRHRDIMFEVGHIRTIGGSKENVGGPFWSDYSETKSGILNGLHQYVGHSRKDDIEVIKFNEKTSITYCDVLSTQEKFLTIEI